MKDKVELDDNLEPSVEDLNIFSNFRRATKGLPLEEGSEAYKIIKAWYLEGAKFVMNEVLIPVLAATKHTDDVIQGWMELPDHIIAALADKHMKIVEALRRIDENAIDTYLDKFYKEINEKKEKAEKPEDKVQ